MKSLQREIKQSRPFASLEEEASLNIARTAAKLDHRTIDLLRPHGITPTQYNVLRILRGAGAGGLCRNEIGDRMIAQVPDTTRMLDRLAEMGLVVRVRETDDRRFVRTEITQAGLDLLTRIDAPLQRAHQETYTGMSQTELQTLIDLLEKVRSRL